MPFVFPQALNSDPFRSRFSTLHERELVPRAASDSGVLFLLQKRELGALTRKFKNGYSRIVIFASLPKQHKKEIRKFSRELSRKLMRKNSSEQDLTSISPPKKDDSNQHDFVLSKSYQSASQSPDNSSRRQNTRNIKILIALSTNPDDTLSQEWNYLCNELPALIPQNVDTRSLITWLISHFNVLYLQEDPEKNDTHHLDRFDRSPDESKATIVFKGSHEQVLLPLAEELNENNDSCSISPIRRSKSLSGIEKKSSLMDNLSSQASIWSYVSTVLGNFSRLDLSVALFANAVALVSFHVSPLAAFSILLIIFNTFLLQYLIWKSTISSNDNTVISSQGTSLPSNDQQRLLHSITENLDETFSEYSKDEELSGFSEDINSANEKKLTVGTTSVDSEIENLTPEFLDRKNRFGTWKRIPGSSFNVRQGPNYSANKTKSPSQGCLYEPVHVDLFSSPKKITHIARFFDLNLLIEDIQSLNTKHQDFHLPKLLIINTIIPSYAPGLFSSTTDGEGVSFTVFCKLSKETLENLSKDNVTPSMRLLSNFMKNPFDSSMSDRFKMIGRSTNMEELNFGRFAENLVRRYNSTPFLLRTKNKEIHVFKGENYLEIDVDVHRFALLCKNGLYQMKHILKKMRGEFAFLIEGRSDDELPEQLAACFEIYGIDYLNALPFPFPPIYY